MGLCAGKSKAPSAPAVSGGSNQITPQSVMSANTRRKLRIIHFNDVYEIEHRDDAHPGAAKFAAAVKQSYTEHTHVLFSGDCLNPCELSTTTKGGHMVPIMNELRVEAAVFGNHEFDFGIGPLRAAMEKMNFPWLCSNLKTHDGTVPALTVNHQGQASGIEKMIFEWRLENGEKIKVGMMGLIEHEWLQTLGMVDINEFDYSDYVEVAQRLVGEFQDEQCKLVIALTHMREPNDIRLAREVDGLHLILGGHDHHYAHSTENDVTILKSGSEFREFSTIDVEFNATGRPRFSIKQHCVGSECEDDDRMMTIVNGYTTELRRARTEPIVTITTPLETRFASVRTQETNFGNFVADCMRRMTNSDCALLNSGTFRSDRLFPVGELTLGDLNTILPMLDRVVQMNVPGWVLHKALENAVSKYPTTAGRFVQVSGVEFAFQPEADPRVQADSILIDGDPLDYDRVYTVATKAYIANGKDGYDMFNLPEVKKQPCSEEKDLDNLPVLKYAIIEELKDISSSGNKLELSTQSRIRNLVFRSHLTARASDTSLRS